MIGLQPVLIETLKQDSSRHQVWNVDKLYKRRNMCIKREKKLHMWDKVKNIHHHIYKEYNVCKNGHKAAIHEVRKDTSKSHYISQSTLPLSSISYASSPPNIMTTLICKITPPFCHEWQRVHHWEVVISTSLEELEPSTPSTSSPLEEDSSVGLGEGEGAKSPRRDWRRVVRPILVFIWHISSDRRSRRLPKLARIC